LIPIDVVGVRKYGGGSYYLPLPAKLLKKLGLKEGDSFVCYETEKGISYEKINSPEQTNQKVEMAEVLAD